MLLTHRNKESATCCPAGWWSLSPFIIQRAREEDQKPIEERRFATSKRSACPVQSVSPPAHLRSCPRAGGRLRALEACRGVSRMSSNDEVTKLWRVRKTVHKMLEDRKYLVSQEDLKRSKESVRARDGERQAGASASRACSVLSSRRSLANCRSERTSPSWHQRRTTQTTWCAAAEEPASRQP